MDDDESSRPIPYTMTPLGRMEVLVEALRRQPEGSGKRVALSVSRTMVETVWGRDVAEALFD